MAYIHKETKRLTPAQRRVLLTARQLGAVRISGGYGASNPGGHLPGFDARCVIDYLIALRLLRPGEWSNTFTLTDAGAQRVQAMRAGAPA